MGVKIRYRQDKALWIVSERSDGSRRERSFKDEKEARTYAAKSQAELDQARFNGVMGRKPRRTFMEGLMRWIDEYDVTSQESNIKNVSLWMEESAPGVLIGQETLDAGRRMQRDLKAQGLAQSTINNRIQVVKRVLSLAFKKWDWIDTPLDGKLRKPTPKNERHVYLDEYQLRRLVEAVPEEMPVERSIIALAILTGMRRGELFTLDPSNVFAGRIVLRPDQTKNGRTRTIPLPPDGECLVTMLPFDTTPHRLRKAFEAARAAIKRPELRFHDLRHTYASLLAQAGESMTSIQSLLGHSSLVVTSRYAHADPNRWAEIAGKLPRIGGQNADSIQGGEAGIGLKH